MTTATDTTPAAVTVSEAVEIVAEMMLPSPTALLTPPVPLEAVRRWLWCQICEQWTRHELDDCFYACQTCRHEIRYVINEAKPLWAIR